jgi:hypothetical protein
VRLEIAKEIYIDFYDVCCLCFKKLESYLLTTEYRLSSFRESLLIYFNRRKVRRPYVDEDPSVLVVLPHFMST